MLNTKLQEMKVEWRSKKQADESQERHWSPFTAEGAWKSIRAWMDLKEAHQVFFMAASSKDHSDTFFMWPEEDSKFPC